MYDQIMAPLEKQKLAYYRQYILKNVGGNILEIGAKSGVNIKYYNMNNVSKLTISDLIIYNKLHQYTNNKIILKEANVEKLPFDNESFDSVVFTLVFCTVNDVSAGLKEISRVLKKNGRIYFIEHITPSSKMVASLFNFINPPYSKIAHGCNLNRNFKESILKESLNIIEDGYFFKKIGYYGILEKSNEN